MALHCRDGRDRTGMVAARLLVELGCHPSDAINRVRGARPGAIATAEQEAYVRRQVAVPEPYEGMQLGLLDEDPYREPVGAWSTGLALSPVPAATHLQGLPSQLVRDARSVPGSPTRSSAIRQRNPFRPHSDGWNVDR